jgi:hypothetical protein
MMPPLTIAVPIGLMQEDDPAQKPSVDVNDWTSFKSVISSMGFYHREK